LEEKQILKKHLDNDVEPYEAILMVKRQKTEDKKEEKKRDAL
jgi:hypothetical protein